MENNSLFDEIEGLLVKIEGRLKIKILPQDVSLTAKTPFKVVSIREIYAHRTYDFAMSSIILLKEYRLIPAMLLVRSIMETNSIFFRINELLSNSIKNKNSIELDNEATLILLGTRDVEEEEFRSKNIMGYIEKIAKTIPDYKYIYDSLSEFVHPNHDGCLGSYGEIDEDSRCTYLGFNVDKNYFIYSETIKFLFLNLELFFSEYERNEILIPNLIPICEEELKNSSN